jgi:hypothetical protein
MSLRILGICLKWAVLPALLAALLAGGYFIHQAARDRLAAQSQAGDSNALKKRERVPGEITLKADYAAGLFLEVEPARSVEAWYEPVTVYGQVVPNPLASVEVRSPFAGTLRDGSAPWPRPGQWVKAGSVLGWVDIRVGPQDRLELQNKLNQAAQTHKGALDTLKIKQAHLSRLENASQTVSLRELEEARVDFNKAKTEEALAKSSVDLWQEALREIDRVAERKSSIWSQVLKMPAAGEVIDLVGKPGTAVEAGGIILKLVDFRKLLIRLDLPPEALAKGPPKTVELIALPKIPWGLRGARNQPQTENDSQKITAHLLGAGPAINPATQFAAYFYQVEAPPSKNGQGTHPTDEPEASATGEVGLVTNGFAWRPGLLVKGLLRLPPGPNGKSQEAVAVPSGALLYHQGRALVYVQKSKDEKAVTFARCEVQVLGRDGSCWIIAANNAMLGDQVPVVIRNTQLLLSEEFKLDVDDD